MTRGKNGKNNMNIDNLMRALEHAKGLGVKTVSFYREQKECSDNPKSLDFDLNNKSFDINNMLVYGHNPNESHLEIPIKGI